MKFRRSIFVRVTVSAAMLILFLLFSSANISNRYIVALENQLYDFRLRQSLLNTVDDKVVILDIDEESIERVGHWPWSRVVLAELMNQLYDTYEIKVLGFDVVFPELEKNTALPLLAELKQMQEFAKYADYLSRLEVDLQGDMRFAESLIGRNVVIGFTFEDLQPGVEQSEYQQKGFLTLPIISKDALVDIKIDFYQAGGYIANYDPLAYITNFSGFFNYPRESSTLRRVPLLYQYNGDTYPSLALQMVLSGLGIENVLFSFAKEASEKNSLSLEHVLIGEHKVPVNGKVSAFVPYRGGQKSFNYISAASVLAGEVPIEDLKDKYVLLGTSAAGLLDLRSTPVGDSYPGVEVHANIISGILDDRFKSQPSIIKGVEYTLLTFAAILLTIYVPRLGAIGASAIMISFIGLLYGLSYWFWYSYDIVLPLANTGLLIISLSFFLIVHNFFVESRRKRRMNRLFGQYIPKELVSELDASSHELSLAGESRHMSVLFSDVRSFTTISEGLDPQELTTMMNEFLTPITKAIHHNRGTIDKYMGDAVMAFWGAPLIDERHANNAVASAFEMIDAMYAIQPEFKSKGWPEIKIGIGISSGDMRVGNMGSEFRMAYTVLGDTVNLGSRLEGLTKNYGVDILVNEETMRLATDYAFREIDRVRVKGKLEPVKIFEPIKKQAQITEFELAELQQYQQALALYHKRQWQEAEQLLKQLHSSNAATIYDIYLQRIAAYKQQEPDADWDGVFTFTTK